MNMIASGIKTKGHALLFFAVTKCYNRQKQGTIYFGSHFEGTVSRGKAGTEAGVQDSWSHTASAVRKRRGMMMINLFSQFYSVGDPSKGGCRPLEGGRLSTSKNTPPPPLTLLPGTPGGGAFLLGGS